ncbi:hypothetical protein [Marinicrinis lubricantis]|uniref:Uncharacterized protein n=1 Tax=Marinicrinis lubricantis TaxID=2086470 RepID=A0ABW1ITD7_9BACL
MQNETVKLSRLVLELKPELYPFLKPVELNTTIVLRDGIDGLSREDADEIVRYSIIKHQDLQLLQ